MIENPSETVGLGNNYQRVLKIIKLKSDWDHKEKKNYTQIFPMNIGIKNLNEILAN